MRLSIPFLLKNDNFYLICKNTKNACHYSLSRGFIRQEDTKNSEVTVLQSFKRCVRGSNILTL